MKRTEKLDLYKLHSADYAAPKKPVIVEIRPAKYLAITGRGEPGGEIFTAKLGALYNVAFTVKMTKKFAGQDYSVCKLEGLWWGDGKKRDFFQEPPATWNWKLIIRVPEFINEADVDRALQKLQSKGKGPEVTEVKVYTYNEGPCVQMLHLGPYSEESKSIAELSEFARQQGKSFHGLHHEIYLSDPRRVPAEKLRTILRIPVH